MQFTYSAITEAKLEQLISRERLQSYSIASGGSLNAALQLYVWNCAVSGALYGPLQSVEIALRNSINRALVAGVSTDWPTDPKFLSIDARFARDIADARENIVATWVRKNLPPMMPAGDIAAARPSLEARARAAGSGVVSTSHIVAEVSFGFWVNMFKRDYQHSLFGPYLSKVFPVGIKRASVSAPLNRLKNLRNRIAHHEPVHGLPLESLYGEILQMAEWLSPELAGWIRYHSRCPLLINDAPRQRQQF